MGPVVSFIWQVSHFVLPVIVITTSFGPTIFPLILSHYSEVVQGLVGRDAGVEVSASQPHNFCGGSCNLQRTKPS